MKVEFASEASVEILAARDHYEAEREGLGEEFMLEMRELQRQIGLLPLRFPVIQATHGAQPANASPT
jgi:hypothetical protein